MENKLKQWLEKHFIYINIGLLLTGISICLLALPYTNGERIDSRFVIGSCCIGFWYLTFPLLEEEKKEKMLFSIARNTIFTCFSFAFGIKAVSWLSCDDLSIGLGILAALFLIMAFSYFCYIFRVILHIFHICVKKISEYLEPVNESNASTIRRAIEGITAFVLAITGFIASIVSFYTLVRSFWG